VYAFRGSALDEEQHRFVLHGVLAKKRYRLHFHDHSSPDRIVSGDELLRSGLSVNLPIPNSSELIFFVEEEESSRALDNTSNRTGK
jgi:hypothetical protein